jgi:pectate lyase
MRCATYITSAAANFNAENISFKNDYDYSTADGKSNKSADALRVDADNASFVNVKMTSVQDTLYMNQGKQFYYKCRIEGLVDYIYSGEAARALFDDCELVFIYQSTKSGGYVCAPKTASGADYGLTFRNCVVTGEDGCTGSDYKLARPWGADAYVTWINCYMGKSVWSKLPYADMNGTYSAARFYEYGSYGPGYEINADRRQISKTKAEQMVSDDYLGWAPYTEIINRAESYKGSRTSGLKDTTNTATRVSYLYDKSDGADEDKAFQTNIARYNMEGYASVYGVTGGGLQKEDKDGYDNPNYYKVGTAEDFLKALESVKASGKASTIELTADINLGCQEVPNFANYSDVIKEYGAQALLHPTLIESGVSIVTITKMHNLTIFSQNGSSIKHANILFKNSSNIIIRNIKFDELWEWDEYTEGGYDRNDWDYMTIDTGSDGIWIDHCTFYKAYDGVIDVKNPVGVERVTISWCEFLPGSENDTFFDEMMNLLKDNPTQYKYYNSLLQSGMTDEEIRLYAYGQKKTHLFGQSAEATNAAGIRVTLANNTYKNSMDRMPRLRYGIAHVYNCIMDASDLFRAKEAIKEKNPEAAKHIVSNGVSSTCDGQILVENSYINNIINALNSGNGSDTSGYINAINSLYYIMGTRYQLVPKVNTTKAGEVVKTTNADEFKSALGYTYNLRDAEKLSTEVASFAGAGKLTMSVLQWEKTKYNAEYEQELAEGAGVYTNDNLPTSPYQSDEVVDDDSDEGFNDSEMDDDDYNNGGAGNNGNGGSGTENGGNGGQEGGGNVNGGNGSGDSVNGNSGNNAGGGSVDNSGSGDGDVSGGDDSTSGSGSGANGSSGSGSDSTSGSGSGSAGTAGNTGSSTGTAGTTGTTGAAGVNDSGTLEVGGNSANTTPLGDVLTADDIPGASMVSIDGVEFTKIGSYGNATKNVLQNIDSQGQVDSGETIAQTTNELAQAIRQQMNDGYIDVSVFASENADVTADMINSIIESGGALGIGIVGSDGTVKAVLTLDGNSLQRASTNFSLKITVDPQTSTARTKAANLGIGMNSYTVIDFDFSGDLPGVFKVAVDVSDKFVDGTQLALYYNNEQAGRLENQYQVTTVNSGFAEFAISHCSEYVLMDINAAQEVITTNTLTAPQTGDANHLVLWLAMMGIVAAAYFGYSAYAADKKKGEGR